MKRWLIYWLGALLLMLPLSALADLPIFTPRPAQNAETSSGVTIRALTADIHAGDVVVYGTYSQNGDILEKQPIEWVVVAVEQLGSSSYATLLSRSILAIEPYHTQFAKTDWYSCSLRSWLNHDFFQSAFSQEEQSKMLWTRYVDDEEYDIVYCPSSAFYQSNIVPWLSLLKSFTATATRHDTIMEYKSGWWLMDTGTTASRARYVSELTSNALQTEVDLYAGVRPVIDVLLP